MSNTMVPHLPPWERPLETLTVPYNYGCPNCGCMCPRKTEREISGGFVVVWATCSQDHVYILDFEGVPQ